MRRAPNSGGAALGFPASAQPSVAGNSRVVHRLPSTVCRLPSTVYRLPSTVCRLPSAVYRLPSTVHRRLPSTVYRLPSVSTSCPRCHEPASGKFCANCGSALPGATCPDCGGALTPGAQFCHHCGAAMKGAPSAAPSRVPWIVTGVALVAVIALVLFQASRSATDAGPADRGQAGPMAGPMAGGAGGGAAGGMPDIASMSPQEQADRLFNRVMTYASQGKSDSAAIFAPMALQVFDMLAPLDAHQRYDVGLIALVAGQLGRAKVEADSILLKNNKDLLGLTLAMRVAEASQNSAAAGDFGKRLIAAEPAERKTGREEYTFHANDIDAAVKDARARKP
ncbi:MAG: zinc ribbon domain-containing protein [Gemmatimonadaceae bacterium]